VDVHELILRTRTCRRFHQDRPVSMETLRSLVEMARVAQSPWNQQAIKFILCNDADTNGQIFSHLQWASRMPDWPGPAEGERPTAYIVIVADKELGKLFNYDHPVAGTAMLLGATEMGLAGCLIGAFSRKSVSKVLELSERYEPLLVVALGERNEAVVIDPVGPDGNTAYWNDSDGVHHVPKRSLDELILREI